MIEHDHWIQVNHSDLRGVNYTGSEYVLGCSYGKFDMNQEELRGQVTKINIFTLYRKNTLRFIKKQEMVVLNERNTYWLYVLAPNSSSLITQLQIWNRVRQAAPLQGPKASCWHQKKRAFILSIRAYLRGINELTVCCLAVYSPAGVNTAPEPLSVGLDHSDGKKNPYSSEQKPLWCRSCVSVCLAVCPYGSVIFNGYDRFEKVCLVRVCVSQRSPISCWAASLMDQSAPSRVLYVIPSATDVCSQNLLSKCHKFFEPLSSLWWIIIKVPEKVPSGSLKSQSISLKNLLVHDPLTVSLIVR